MDKMMTKGPYYVIIPLISDAYKTQSILVWMKAIGKKYGNDY